MAYKTVMVSLALDRPNAARLEITRQLAERFGAGVIGITAGEFSPPLHFTIGEQAQKALDQGHVAIRSRIDEVESEFRTSMHNGAATLDWRCAEDFPTRYFVEQARAADIIVIGEDSRESFADPFMNTNPADLIMQLGRPLLVVADSCNWLDLRSVLVAWKDTPEARRAIVDALPMLRIAKDVSVVGIMEAEDVSQSAVLSRVKDVVAWLLSHGVVAFEQVPDERGNAAAQLEQIASATGAGVIVAGAYGHSRLREWILGGVTKRLVNPSNRCSLLSR